MEECYGMEALIFPWFQLLQKIELYGVKIKIINPPHRLIKKRPKSRTGWKGNLSWFSRKVWSVTAMSAQCPFYQLLMSLRCLLNHRFPGGRIHLSRGNVSFLSFLLDSHSCGDLWWCVESWGIPWDCLSSFLSTESRARSAKNTVSNCKECSCGSAAVTVAKDSF